MSDKGRVSSRPDETGRDLGRDVAGGVLFSSVSRPVPKGTRQTRHTRRTGETFVSAEGAGRDADETRPPDQAALEKLRAIHRAMGFCESDVQTIEAALLSGTAAEIEIRGVE